ncbi:AAA family ATPase [Actinoplanes siamensis]|uniref:Chaperone n=1 Tax=Actinoplanes siamensis TaxID=1223317 RepID=A0A919N9S9_9ACTN|nr:AAA family ATPase [Actinoplanes siamensis]GIF06854.1 chaperone [Actinoplanes siamensis]
MATPSEFLPGFPAFTQELAGTLAVHSQYVLHGNVRDLYLVPDTRGRAPGGVRPTPLLEVLWQALHPSGYRCLIVSDQVDGITVYPPGDPAARAAAERLLGRRMIGRKQTLERLRTCMARVAGAAEPPPIDADAVPPAPAPDDSPAGPDGVRAALVIDYAARIPRSQTGLEGVERDFFLFAQKLAVTAETHLGGPPDRPADLFNPVIWLTEGERDLPAWLTVGMERVRSIAVAGPGLSDRMRAARYFAPIITGDRTAPPDTDPDVARFAQRTDDMTLHAMREIARLAADRRMPIGRIEDAIRIYRIGVDQNPWRQETVRRQIMLGESEVPKRIHGQQPAVVKAFDILKRAALGLSGAQASSSANRPRGVLFLAGPTGVGKTELAKQLATMLFGDPDAYLRFDMSEFSASHSADRLTGAPPGYVGYEAGGELTGAIRRKPFSVVLFDEFEKANRQIFDKFLQILDDGRLTDGQGVTTYFTECMLIFTSNLGIFRDDPATGEKVQLVHPGIDHDTLERTVKEAIKDHFTRELGRPELLNRFGDNIVVFDFISEPTALRILDGQLRNVEERLSREHGVHLELGGAARQRLQRWCAAPETLTNGGRGIGNEVESKLINPLARYLFDQDVRWGKVRVEDITAADGLVTLHARHER